MNVTAVSNAHVLHKTKSLAILCTLGILLSMSTSLPDMSAFAESSQTTVMKLNDELSLQKTVTAMSIPENNTLPWGTVKGKVHDPAQGYPVIIQFFNPIEDIPIHVAQVSLKGDGSFEYRFRVSTTDEGNITHFFEGDYDVKIFKVVNTPKDDLFSI
jgi:hypothetical protein